MTARRKNTDAMKFIMDEVDGADLNTASQEQVDRYLESKGVRLRDLDSKIDRFMVGLAGKLAMSRAARECASLSTADPRRKQVASMSESEILARLVAVYGSKEAIPLAARMNKAFSRSELESLYLDATDEQ